MQRTQFLSRTNRSSSRGLDESISTKTQAIHSNASSISRTSTNTNTHIKSTGLVRPVNAFGQPQYKSYTTNNDGDSASSISSTSTSISIGKSKSSSSTRTVFNKHRQSCRQEASLDDACSASSSTSSSTTHSKSLPPQVGGLSRQSRREQVHLPFLRNPNHNKVDVNDQADLSDSSSTSSLDSTSGSEDFGPDIPTASDLLAFGLTQVGFGPKRQKRAGHKLNVTRFKAHFGVEPRTVRVLFRDIKKKYPKTQLVYFMLTLNWFNLYDVEHVLAGKWNFCEEHIGQKLKEYARMIQSLKDEKIVFDGWEDDECHIVTADGVNFMTQEFRLDPSSKW